MQRNRQISPTEEFHTVYISTFPSRGWHNSLFLQCGPFQRVKYAEGKNDITGEKLDKHYSAK